MKMAVEMVKKYHQLLPLKIHIKGTEL